jgi:hypothetical protein
LGPQFIIAMFGAQPITGCTFDFSTALTNVSTMLAVARVVEHVGIGAYLGAAHLIEDSVILTYGASVKARHGTVSNLFNDASAISTALGLPLLPNEALSVTCPFITNLNSSGCNFGITRTLS